MNTDDIIEFVTDPLRLTLIVAGIVVLLAILILGRRSSKQRDMLYRGSPGKDYAFNSRPDDLLVDEEIIVLPRRKKESEVAAEENTHFSAHFDKEAPRVETFEAKSTNFAEHEPEPERNESPMGHEDSVNQEGSATQGVSSINKATPNIRSVPNASFVSNSNAPSDPYLMERHQPEQNLSERNFSTQNASKKNTRENIIPERAISQRIHAESPVAVQSVGTRRAPEPPSRLQTVKEDKYPEKHPEKQALDRSSKPTVTPKKRPPQQRFFVLNVVAIDDATFSGRAIFDATQTLGMALGKYNVFHYPADAAHMGDSAFCLVNMTTEASFDIENLGAIQTHGVSLILTLPTHYSDGATVFSNMLAVAHALSKKLDGDILDQTRQTLTTELVTKMKDEITQFEEELQGQLEPRNPVVEY